MPILVTMAVTASVAMFTFATHCLATTPADLWTDRISIHAGVHVFAASANSTTNVVLSGHARAADIYCSGKLLDAVQRAGIFNDSKHFVDMPMRSDPEEVLAAFDELLAKSKQPDAGSLRAFVEAHFDEPGAELVPHTAADFHPDPPLSMKVADANLRDFLKGIHSIWPVLLRTMAPSVERTPQRHSALFRRFPFVIPGGRFRETYYWDTFWIVEGLLASGMFVTARGVVQNLLDDVAKFGFVPNGGRIYYMNRSQPPMLCDMVASVARAMETSAGGDAKPWLANAVPLLQREHEWWMGNHSHHAVDVGGGRKLNRYWASWYAPRPESYREDFEVGRGNSSIYHGVSSAAETGWDFSSRWTREERLNSNDDLFSMHDIDASRVIPVDLNAIMYRAELTLAALLEVTATGRSLADVETAIAAGQIYTSSEAASFAGAADERRRTMEEMMWQASLGRWVDLWLPTSVEEATGKTSLAVAQGGPTAADFAAPLWAGLVSPADAALVTSSLENSRLLGPAGLSTTLRRTGQQWDEPNAWAPVQAMLVEGLARLPKASGGPRLAADVAQRWVGTCYAAWRKSNFMYEKYDARSFGVGGGGGEYKPQVGFGWSNGVVLMFLRDYGSELVAPGAV
eukprot:TRINITY_DN10387_c0_g1_i1.p1 TRINITY_DN10387_c0_g1~~TRINITY_DN10387_c0_g1_i1.p1  ORF type:complete len:660 (+),score=114.29 TRINITY_DN10387_c0_g1_i1:97-1980(+)